DPDNQQRAASNMKIVTAVTSLATMGPNKRFVTRVRSAANGTDLILEGGGDPLLYRSQVAALADRTAKTMKRGSRVIVHVDGDLFAPHRRGPGWTPGYSNYLIADVQALAMFGDHSHQPALNAAQVFTSRLRDNGINARIGRNEDAAPGARTIARTAGHTVSQAVGVMLSQSESNVAEVLFRQVAVASGLPATWVGGISATKRALESIGVDSSDVRIYDGSGLSRRDRLTPRFLVDLLRTARELQGPRFAAMFKPSAMPIAGRTGTLNTPYGRYDTRPSRCAAGRVQAKTGTLYDVIALSGVATTVGGRRLLFSMIVNSRPTGYSKLTTRRALDGLAATITGCWR
ncbi:MAG: D-alanyl-D-alanine carboxypeptidase/D-alanyl-D-alanine-endopeptidase, partial [bacterium]|nr:D-alanyl-D-alanine carboxypeptidase/D-alanyl-D-alanine-endopeptidase [bacterium]